MIEAAKAAMFFLRRTGWLAGNGKGFPYADISVLTYAKVSLNW
jgi:hypothetical protein